ncbi:hypothetical protein MJO29_006200, partial [Puccinia striiformis f. sp. tritici]
GDPSKGAIEGDFDYNQDTDNGSVTILLRLTGQAKVYNLSSVSEKCEASGAMQQGNQSTAAHIILKYLALKESLALKLQNCWEEDSLYPIYHVMSKQVEKHLNEAIRCHTLVIATILHPYFRMYILELAFGLRSLEAVEALQLLCREFVHTKESLKRKQPPTQDLADVHVIDNKQSLIPQPQSLMAWLASRLESNVTTQEDKIADYLNASLSFDEQAMNNKATPLHWWKLHMRFIILL